MACVLNAGPELNAMQDATREIRPATPAHWPCGPIYRADLAPRACRARGTRTRLRTRVQDRMRACSMLSRHVTGEGGAAGPCGFFCVRDPTAIAHTPRNIRPKARLRIALNCEGRTGACMHMRLGGTRACA